VSDEGIDRMVVQIGSDWLAQYARFIRRSPVVVTKLADRPEEFELVPIPRMLLDRLAIPGIIESGMLGDWNADLKKLVQLSTDPTLVIGYPDAPPQKATEVVSQLRSALENGAVEALRRLISPNYIDQDGRDCGELQAALEYLIKRTVDRRLDVTQMRTDWHGPDKVQVKGEGTWQSRLTDRPGAPDIVENIEFRAILSRGANDEWLISELTMT
jgi:hypothetical protein